MTEGENKAKRYAAIKNRLALIEPLYVLFFLAALQTSGVSRNIKFFSFNISSNFYGAVIIYAILFSLIYYAAMFCLNLYRGFIVEHNFGLSNQTMSDWLKEEVKKGILSLIMFIIFIEFLYLFMFNSPEFWWIFMAMGSILFTIILAKIFPILILPLFFKFEKIGDNELGKKLTQLAARCGIKILDIFKVQLSAKTKKANAALVGIGKTRRVLLGDTLIKDYSSDEIEVVLAHELAHHKLGHMWKLLSFSALSTVAVFFFVNLLSTRITGILNVEAIEDLTAFPSILFIISLFGVFLNPLQNTFSRRLESAADMLSLKMTRLPDAFISCMDKLSKQNLSDPNPSKFIETVLYDHPPVSRRIKMAEEFKNIK
ncbi:MAG: M48 family metallopeptidase [Candidatus Omnitrophica bacterium]|nr:M48 family metallopeptidase [Candidatus Omnitrophota bacterium]